MVRSFLKIYLADLGVEAENLLVTRVTLPPSRYADAESRVAFFESLSARIESMPGVESVALGEHDSHRSSASRRIRSGWRAVRWRSR